MLPDLKIPHVVALVACVALSAACAKTIDIDDLEGRVTSIGPVFVDGDGLTTVRFTVYDTDSDPVDVNAAYRVVGDAEWTDLPSCTPAAGESCEVVGGLAQLPTDQDRDVQYQIGWNVPSELAGSEVELRMYVSDDVSRGVRTVITP